MNERPPRQNKSARDGSIIRFHPPQVRIVAVQGLVVLLATTLVLADQIARAADGLEGGHG